MKGAAFLILWIVSTATCAALGSAMGIWLDGAGYVDFVEGQMIVGAVVIIGFPLSGLMAAKLVGWLGAHD